MKQEFPTTIHLSPDAIEAIIKEHLKLKPESKISFKVGISCGVEQIFVGAEVSTTTIKTYC